jgi:hypothetical protein
MFIVYEIGKRGKPYEDGKRFYRYEDADRFECEVYIDHHLYSANGTPLLFEIVEE